jgi:hypothetical protein
MKYKEYVKAFKVLTNRLCHITHDKHAKLAIFLERNRTLTPGFQLSSDYKAFDSLHCIYNDEHLAFDNVFCNSQQQQQLFAYIEPGHLIKTFSIVDYISYVKLWLDITIGNSLNIFKYLNDNEHKLISHYETVESLCVQYDMTQV